MCYFSDVIEKKQPSIRKWLPQVFFLHVSIDVYVDSNGNIYRVEKLQFSNNTLFWTLFIKMAVTVGLPTPILLSYSDLYVTIDMTDYSALFTVKIVENHKTEITSRCIGT